MAETAAETVLEGTLENVIFVNEESGWSVFRLAVPGRHGPVTAVGNLAEVQPGESLRLEGRWEDDRKYGRQFRVTSYRTVEPTTVEAMERYLGSGLIAGIGKAMAKRLVEHFGADTLEVIDRYSARLTEVEGIGPKRSELIRQAWVEQREIKEVMLFLQAHKVGIAHAVRIYKTYGSDAVELVRRDPYRLAADIHGIGFKTADEIARHMGIPRDSPQRAAAAVIYLLGQASERGHLYLPRQRLVARGTELLEVEAAVVDAAVGQLAAEGRVVVEGELDDGGDEGRPVYLPSLYLAEAGLAQRLRALMRTPVLPLSIDVEAALSWLRHRQGLELAPRQAEAIRRAVEAKVLVITGGPGTGKTTLVKGIVSILSRKGRVVLLAAPTGRAAKRLTEATGAEAKTVHRLLEFSPRSMGFERGPDRPLTGDLLLVDEASMLDAVLTHHIVRALPDEAQLVLVGDVDQLPSVGPGNVLADLIRSGAVEVVRLTEIFRQARESAIVVNAHRINQGQLPELESDPGSDFFFIPRRDPQAVLDTISLLVTRRIPESFGLDPMTDIQVLSPMNRGPLGVESLNRTLRQLLNPEGREVVRGGRMLRQGDKVMQIRNNYDLDVFNGDLGRIVEIDSEEQQVRAVFDGRQVIYDLADLDELVPAYACSIHKSQGSEYPCVVLPLHGQHYVMLERNLLYTALTRARRLAVVVGERRALAVAVRNARTRTRYTLLRPRLEAAER